MVNAESIPPIFKEAIRDLIVYADVNLKIRDKQGEVVPLRLNRAQKELHRRLEEQKRRTGRVRATIIKGRQQGISTYISGRFYHKTATSKGMKTFIFAHDSNGSNSLYSMVKTYYDSSHDCFKPSIGATNAREFVFNVLGSGYRVGTAGNQSVGRSMTVQQLHWSEVAYSPNCDDHVGGLMQTVPDMEGTEIILESTSAGSGDYFYRKVMDGMDEGSEWQTIFLAWYWQDEYKKPVPFGMQLEQEEQDLLNLYSKDGLTPEHLIWRRHKLREFEGDALKFKREYPFNIQEAFEASDDDSIIKAADVRAAMTKDYSHVEAAIRSDSAPLVIGVDPARFGDKIGYVMRRGRCVPELGFLPAADTVATFHRLGEMIKDSRCKKMFIDAGSFGIAIYDMLRAAGFGDVVEAIDFGGRKSLIKPERFYNKRAEMYGEAAAWFKDTPCHIYTDDVKMSELLIMEAASVRKAKDDYNSLLKLEEKVDIKKRLGHSPDLIDALVLTFAQPVMSDYQDALFFHNPGAGQSAANWGYW